MTDLFNLNQTFSSSSIVSTTDVQNVKHALNRLGYYAPPKDIGIMGFTDKAIFDALKQFQKDKNLLVTGEMRPSDTTVQMINRAIEDQPITTKYIWRTVQDDKVRSSHAVREGKVFSWLDHPVPGEEFKCRCWAEPFQGQKTANQIYDPPIELVYPELPL